MMSAVAALITDAILVVIFLVVLITGLCATKIAVRISRPESEPAVINRHVVPGFPCDGTLLLLAPDGIMYPIPRGKVVVLTEDMVREVHCGRVVRGCDRYGLFTYCEDEDDEHRSRDEGQDQGRGTMAVDNIYDNWSGSLRSQDITLSVSDDDSADRYQASPPYSPVAAGEETG